jgi:DNA-directed RNA polymerase subunit M/transcription elongation factor TFIIS
MMILPNPLDHGGVSSEPSDRVVCDGCGETRGVETQNTMRPGDWPVCRKADCRDCGQVMRLMEGE